MSYSPCLRLLCGVVLLTLPLPGVAQDPPRENAQSGVLAQVPEVRVEEPLPEDLVAPPEPLPWTREDGLAGDGIAGDLEPLPTEPGASALESISDGAKIEESELLATVRGWAKAWDDQRVDAYLSFYADGFETPDGLARWEWESQRRERLLAPSFIEITIEEPTVRSLAPSRGQVEFIQRYTSDRYSDSVRKTLMLTRAPEGWKILQEESEVLEEG